MQRLILILFLIVGMSCLPEGPAQAEEVPAPCGEETPCEETPTTGSSSPETNIVNLTYEEFKALLDSKTDFLLLDTRPLTSYQFGHIPKAESFPLSDISPASVEKLSKDKLIVVYCQSASCNMSHMAAVKLKSHGFDVKDYKGGVMEWTLKGNTLESVKTDPAVNPAVFP